MAGPTWKDCIAEVAACRRCEAELEPRPVLRVHPACRVLIVGQAPGARVHASGVPWDDRSGDHLREWLDVDRDTFDGPAFGILPMAFCYPGAGPSGDRPPPPVCARTWHDRILEHLSPRLWLLVGTYAQARYLGTRRARTLTETVRAFDRFGDRFPLPHPSWRSQRWRRVNPWFDAEVLPVLRRRVAAACAG